ncbi:cytochrome P450 [Aspergillus granulosus]|uniref:Cytochrome P450 n=1 Tax=Aspergillus granulosus TaxID=176169 RepID=A0ABR4HXW3_9EURO
MSLLFILATALSASACVARLIWYKRFIQYAKFPQMPASLLLGHMQAYNEITQSGPVDRDYDHIFAQIHESLGKPPLFLLDYRPICRPVVVVASHEVAEQISRPTQLFRTGTPKFNLGYMAPIIGQTSMLSAEGNDWKALRKTFNPWFSLQNLMTFLPAILDKTMIFVAHLDRLSETGEEAALMGLTMNLMHDITGATVFDEDLDAQHVDPRQRGELVRAFAELLDAYWEDKIHLPWWLKLGSELKRRQLGRRVDRILESVVRRKYEEWQQQQTQTHRNLRDHEKGQWSSPPAPVPNSIVALIFQNADTDTKTSRVLSPDHLSRTCDQLRTFLLGGHDSPSATIAWVFYELSRTPRVQSAIRAELDTLFGPGTDADAVRAQLASLAGPDLLRRMSYTSAVLKETLRLHTPASTARYAPPGSGFVVRMPNTGEELVLDDVILYNCGSIIHHDQAVFGATADEFMPERWLGNNTNTDKHAPASIPPSAWRPFERGPRSCIGQEFASIVMRAIIAVVARQYDFAKVGLGAPKLDAATGRPILSNDGQYEVAEQVYNIRQITARPVDGIMVKVNRVQSHAGETHL